jgi:hypothetical protein
MLNPGQVADLVLAWRQVAGLIESIPHDRPLADDMALTFRLPPPTSASTAATVVHAPAKKAAAPKRATAKPVAKAKPKAKVQAKAKVKAKAAAKRRVAKPAARKSARRRR